MTTISVAICTYNGSKFIEKQLESIENQTLKPDEIFIFDDGSDQFHVNEYRRILEKYENIELFLLENVGIISNFERAIKHCSSKYVALSDQDDIWTEDHLEELYKSIGNYDICYGDLLGMSEDGQMIFPPLSQKYRMIGQDSKSDLAFRSLIHGNFLWGSSAMIRRDLLSQPIPQTSRYHDWWLASLALNRNGIIFVPKPITLHRFHNNNSSAHFDKKSTIYRMINFFKNDRKDNRTKNINNAKNCVLALKKIYKDEDKLNHIHEYEIYIDAILNRNNRLFRFVYTFRNIDLIFSSFPRWKRFLMAISRCI